MNVFRSVKFRSLVSLGGLLFCVILLVMFSQVGWVFSDSSEELRPVDEHGKTSLYFVSKTAERERALTDKSISSNIQAIHNFHELKQNFSNDPSTIGAIIIHKSQIEAVERAWIQDIYSRGMVVAGVDITIRDLAILVNDETVINDKVWTDGWQREPFYSILSFAPTGTESEQKLADEEGKLLGIALRNTDNVIDEDFEQFFYLIDRDVTVLTDKDVTETNK